MKRPYSTMLDMECKKASDNNVAREGKLQWSHDEDLFIMGAVRRFGTQWEQIAAHLPGRSDDAVRNRWHRLQKIDIGTRYRHIPEMESDEAKWLLEASDAAVGAVRLTIPAPSERARAPWSAEEDRLIMDGVEAHGCRWRLIVANLPGRSDSSARNRYLRLQKERPEDGVAAESVLRAESIEQEAACNLTVPFAPPTPSTAKPVTLTAVSSTTPQQFGQQVLPAALIAPPKINMLLRYSYFAAGMPMDAGSVSFYQ